MALSDKAVQRLMIAMGDQTTGREVADAINGGNSLEISTTPGVQVWVVANLIIATSTSTTTDFGSLLVGDQVLMVPATAGSADQILIATAGTLPQAAVVGNAYLVLRQLTIAAAVANKL